MRLTPAHWVAAAVLAIVLHAALFIGLHLPSPGREAGMPGPDVQVIGSAAQVFGPNDRPPEAPSPAIAAETSETITPKPGAKAKKRGPEREAERVAAEQAVEAPTRTIKPDSAEKAKAAETPERIEPAKAKPVAARPAAEAVLPEQTAIKPEADSMSLPMRRPKPTRAERKRASPPARTTPKTSRTRGERKRATSGTGRRRQKSGKRTASERRGTGRRQAAASPGQVRRYAGLVRARIARNRPSSRGRRGTAVVRFAISRSGGLRYVRLARSSGDRTLDRAAVGSVRRAAPFPRPPRGMRGGQLTFSIPFRFR